MAYALAVLGSMAAQGPVITWVAGHRKHHALTDVEGDPHSPHFLPGSGCGVVRALLLLHVTGSVNSLCHVAGERRFATEDRSTNILWLSLLSFGEAWHHNHHAFPRSAFHGLRVWEPDPAGWTITGLERLGLVWDVVRIAPERQLARQAASPLPV